MELLRCPVCGVEWRDAAVTLDDHVNAHFDDAEAERAAGGAGRDDARPGGTIDLTGGEEDSPSGGAFEGDVDGPGNEDRDGEHDACFICGGFLAGMGIQERNEHANRCLDDQDVRDDQDLQGELRTAGDVQRHKADVWWSPVDGNLQKIPSNFSPGLLPVLLLILQKAYQQGITKQAVICHSGTVHIKGASGYDMGWGCGYRNCLMAISALLVAFPRYRAVFPSDPAESAPGVGQLQSWIETGWKEGYDEIGNRQMKGKVLGTRKWIGTSDLYAVFSRLGIPCKLYDFPRPPATSGPKAPTAHGALIHFVRTYFDDTDNDTPSLNNTPATAYDMIMRSEGDATARHIRATDKMPLILQHAGHSRTVVGYEVNREGNTNLLLFDPGKTIAEDLRAAGISAAQNTRAESAGHGDSQVAGGRGIKRGSEEAADAQSKSRRKNGREGLRDDEKITKSGWIKKKIVPFTNKGPPEWETKPAKAMAPFRVNLGAINRNAEYQVLMFTGGPLLQEMERNDRKRLSSIALYH